jgi:hypothetical protein
VRSFYWPKAKVWVYEWLRDGVFGQMFGPDRPAVEQALGAYLAASG